MSGSPAQPVEAPSTPGATDAGGLAAYLPPPSEDPAAPEEVLDAFTEWAAAAGYELYPAQEDALLELVEGHNVILATPTGSGKSLVAVGAIFAALADGVRAFYTAPLKALVSEKFFDLCRLFGADRVGMITGDASVNAEAPVIVCTAEILANLALREGPGADVGVVCMDEFHFYAEPDRGWAWQVPLLVLRDAQFLLMSATLGDVTFFRDDLRRRTRRPTAVVANTERPVPLHHSYALTPIHETLEELLTTGGSPVYVVHFTQAAALEQAKALMSVNVCSREEKERIADEIGAFRFTSGFGRTLSRLVRAGIGVHHAGMLPRYRRLVERLTQKGLLKVVCGTDTLGVGINVPIRTVVLTSLIKYDGRRVRMLRAREFHQIAGRAGRAGYDTVGTVVVQAPDYEIENARLLAKAGDDPVKRRRVVRRKPPTGEVSWSKSTFDRLVTAEPEPLRSRFRVTHALVLNVAQQPGGGFGATWRLIADSHEPVASIGHHLDRLLAIYRALLAGGVIEAIDPPDAEGRVVRVTADLQHDFALDQPLSLFALAALELLDPDSVDFAHDVVSVIEATLDDPRAVLMAQQFRARGEAVAAMKAEGMEYEERMELLEDVTWPKPLADLLDGAFISYAKGHPWVTEHELSPKSVVRDMHERAMTFGEYIGHYGLSSTEGLLLRYLADAYRALRRTVPEQSRTEALEDILAWLGEIVRQVDSSLLDEWERLVDPAEPESADGGVRSDPAEAPPVTANHRAFRVLVRNALFRRVELVSRRGYADLVELDGGAGWTAAQWAAALAPYWEEHDVLQTGPDARGPDLLEIAEQRDVWTVTQILDDPAGDHDWAITAEVDLAASDAEGVAMVRVTGFGRIGSFRAAIVDEPLD